MTAQYQLHGIRFSYAQKEILSITEQSFQQGGITALIGANGSGKSTLFKMLAFLVTPQAGSIRFSGKTVHRKDRKRLSRQIGLVTQNPYLMTGSVLKNISLGMKCHGLSPNEQAQRLNRILPLLGLQSLVNRSTDKLSGGEVQKVAIARILVLNPQIILLDEPFTHLDKQSVEELEALIRLLNKTGDKTILFTSHNPLHAQILSDQTYRLINGDLTAILAENIFHGSIANNVFDTGRIKIAIPPHYQDQQHLSIKATQIVISKTPLESSMRNTFTGKVDQITAKKDGVELIIQGAERFNAQITQQACDNMALKRGEEVLISFKSSAIQLF